MNILQRAKNEFTTGAELAYVVTITFNYAAAFYIQFVFASDNNTNHFMSFIYGNISQTDVSYRFRMVRYGDGGENTQLWEPSISDTADSYNISTMSNVGVPGVYRFALNATSFINPPPPLPTGIYIT